jgi:hypothetical protein
LTEARRRHAAITLLPDALGDKGPRLQRRERIKASNRFGAY